MTNEDRQTYLLRFHRFQKSREQFFAPKIFEAIRSQYNTFLSHIYSGHTEHDALHRVSSAPIVKVLRQLYLDAGIQYGAKIRADLNKKTFRKRSKNIPENEGKIFHSNTGLHFKARLPMGFSEQMRQLIMDYFSIDILNQSEGITQTTRELIQQIFTNAYEKGEGIDDIVAQLKDTELSRVRARLIARTETVTSANKGALFVAKDTGLELNKQWLSARDHRVRNLHRAENGKTVGINELFSVGPDLMDHPGDRGGKDGRLPVSAANVCNCRCTLIYIPVD